MSAPAQFPPALIAAIHMGDKREIAAEMACWGIGGGVVAYHGIRPDGVCTCGNYDCANAGKHPDTRLAPHGSRSATTDPRRAAMWFQTHPDHNIALCLGPNLVALDWDPRHGADLSDSCGLPARTMTAQTGGGGMHRLYRYSGRQKLKGGHISPGVDVRTGNQVIVVEKSRHRSGAAYEWRDLEAPIAPFPRAAASRFPNLRPSQAAAAPATLPFDPSACTTESLRPEVKHLRQELLRGKHRQQVRLLLDGQWEQAGYPSQSEAEYNLVLMLSALTSDSHLWQAVLSTSGLGRRDRECSRRDDGHGNKLTRRGYTESLFTTVSARRGELRAIGDPNLELARRVFGAFAKGHAPHLPDRLVHPLPGDVLDGKELRRRGPKIAPTCHRAQLAIVTFLGSDTVVVDHNGYVRIPMGDAADAMQTSGVTLRKAIKELARKHIVETLIPVAYRKKGGFAKDRYLRLTATPKEAMSRLGMVREDALP